MLRSVSACGTARGASRAGCLATCRLAGLGRPGDQRVEPDAHRGVEETDARAPERPARTPQGRACAAPGETAGRAETSSALPAYVLLLPASAVLRRVHRHVSLTRLRGRREGVALRRGALVAGPAATGSDDRVLTRDRRGRARLDGLRHLFFSNLHRTTPDPTPRVRLTRRPRPALGSKCSAKNSRGPVRPLTQMGDDLSTGVYVHARTSVVRDSDGTTWLWFIHIPELNVGC